MGLGVSGDSREGLEGREEGGLGESLGGVKVKPKTKEAA